jgi:N-acetylmuramoyl-L-alanine amidase
MSCLVGGFLAFLLAIGQAAGCVSSTSAQPAHPGAGSNVAGRSAAPLPLAGRIIVIDPGHQLGNHNFPAEINKLVPAGGFSKPCNTTGTATNGGYPEATFAWEVATRLQRKLERLGATVKMTRHANSESLWGPCVDVRGRAGNKAHADLKISIHGDGSYTSGAHGFDVITPPDRAPWTDDIYKPSMRLAKAVRAALEDKDFVVANYVGTDGIDVRSDLATLNLSDVPTVMLEAGNMRDSGDAAVMTSSAGQSRYAAGLLKAVETFLG